MAKTIIAHPAHETTTRVERGRDLYREHADSITFEDGVWYIPSQHDSTIIGGSGRKGGEYRWVWVPDYDRDSKCALSY